MFLGTPMVSFGILMYSALIAFIVFWTGMVYFKSVERRFADEI